jgi:hypothetical protein
LLSVSAAAEAAALSASDALRVSFFLSAGFSSFGTSDFGGLAAFVPAAGGAASRLSALSSALGFFSFFSPFD